MTPEDDRLRQALSRGEPSFTAHSALQQLRPTMQQARLRRRVTASVATLALLAGGSAGAFALVGSQNPPTLRTVNNDESGQSVLPEPTTVPPTTQAVVVATTLPPVVLAPVPTSSVAPEADDAPPEADDGRAPETPTPAPTVASPSPPPPQPPAPTPTPSPTTVAPPTTMAPPTAAAPTTAAPAVLQTIVSDCGDVVVSIGSGTVRIVRITTRPGYEADVSADGPTSIEIVLRSAENSCELHAELNSGGLDIEVQNPSADR